MKRPVVGIEFINRVYKVKDAIGLCIQYQDDADLAHLKGMQLIGKEFTFDSMK